MLGRHIQKPAAALKLDATLCQYVVPTAREARRVFNKAKHEEQRAIKLGQGQVFDGTGSLPAEGGAVADDTVLSSCNGFTVNQCGYGNTTSSARLYLRNFSGSVVETNVLSQSYWRWAGDHVDCTNANGSMFDHVLWEGPDVSDSGAAIRFEPRDCLPSRGEVCSQGSCPIQWAVSTRAWDTGNIQNLWNAAIGYHRFHYWIPEIPGVPFPGIHHMLYHWLRTEFLVNAKHDTWAGTSCQEGGSYGAGFPFYTYQLCQGYLPTAFH
jgi:hypothetical protein